MPVARRLVFGEVADVYDRYRPTYPVALIDDVVAEAGLGPGELALEAGAGTGKATELFIARGIEVVAVEPSPEMARALRRRVGAATEVVLGDFERVELGVRTFPLLYSAQAWHWIDPALGYPRARSLLREGGLLALFWNRIAWSPEDPLRQALLRTYERVAPGMSRDAPMHPARSESASEPDFGEAVAGIDGFADPRVRHYSWSLDYTAEAYSALLATLSEVRLLPAPDRERLLDAVSETITEHGGSMTMPMRTRLCTARAV